MTTEPRKRPRQSGGGASASHRKLDPAEKQRRAAERAKARTHCVKGHERSDETGYWQNNKNYAGGKRWVCRLCARNWQTKHKGRPLIPDSVPIAPKNKDKTHCPAGHEYELWAFVKKDGSRGCRKCVRDRVIRNTYGLEPDEFQKLWDQQGGYCAICGFALAEPLSTADKKASAHVDHCHNSTKVRGLLCGNCNTGLGHFKDDPELLRLAAVYLED